MEVPHRTFERKPRDRHESHSESVPAPTVPAAPAKAVDAKQSVVKETMQIARVIDIDLNTSTNGFHSLIPSIADLSFMLEVDKSILTLSAGKRLFSYLIGGTERLSSES